MAKKTGKFLANSFANTFIKKYADLQICIGLQLADATLFKLLQICEWCASPNICSIKESTMVKCAFKILVCYFKNDINWIAFLIVVIFTRTTDSRIWIKRFTTIATTTFSPYTKSYCALKNLSFNLNRIFDALICAVSANSLIS